MARPRRLDPEEMRRQIIATAREILRDGDGSALTARALAKGVGMPASAIYRIFPTMGDVFMTLNQATFAELDVLFDSLPQDRPPFERLLTLAQGYMGFMRNNPSLWHALFAGERRKGDYPAWYLEAIGKLMKRLAALIAENCPGLSQPAADEAAGRLYVMAHGAISLELDGRLELITPLSGQELALTAMRSLLAELRRGQEVGAASPPIPIPRPEPVPHLR